jgi:hypothetical protein
MVLPNIRTCKEIKMSDDFKFLGKVKLIIEKRASDLVPYTIIEQTFYTEDDEGSASWREELGFLETDQIPLPEFNFKFDVGDRLEFSADFYGHYFSYRTSEGTEYDAEFEFRNVKDLLLWRVVYEQPCEHEFKELTVNAAPPGGIMSSVQIGTGTFECTKCFDRK